MKKKWTDVLSGDVYSRLCNCTTTKSDITALVNARWLFYSECGKAEQGFTKEDALIFVLELLDCNSVDIELTKDEYNELCKE